MVDEAATLQIAYEHTLGKEERQRVSDAETRLIRCWHSERWGDLETALLTAQQAKRKEATHA